MTEELTPPNIPVEFRPRHIALVMDGNGRWAAQRGLKRTEGHKRGEAVLLDMVAACQALDIPYLSAYAFSTENWRRSADEVRFFMGFNRDVLTRQKMWLHERGVKVRWVGRRPRLWRSVLRELESAEELTKDNTSGTLSWHTPDKTIYQRHPNGTITRLPHKTGPHQHHTPATVIPGYLSQQISPDILNRLNRALDTALDNHTHNHTSPGTNTNASGSGTARLETRGPQPGQKPGDYETTPYPQATHTLGLAPLIDQAPPF